jgi:hypothetical protein
MCPTSGEKRYQNVSLIREWFITFEEHTVAKSMGRI